MENCVVVIIKSRIKFFVVFFGVLILISSLVLAYSPYYTHPDLTEEIAKLHNLKNENADLEISQKEINWMRDGAMNEDAPPRWVNHFYDPIHQTGWSGKHFGTLTPEQGQREGTSMAPRPVLASIEWATNQESQAAYGRQYGNQTWQKAIKSYIDGDKKSAFTALGHILHLIEDASVPDHTRDDTHAELYGDPGSPYEKYSKEYTNKNKLAVAENLKNRELLNFATIQGAFYTIANYSNNNFFSEDTISNEEFQSPDLIKLEKVIKNINGDNTLFLKKDLKYLAFLNLKNNKYSTNDDYFILPSYFSNLSSQAVLTGASVLKLFFQEVEKYKQNPELLPKIIDSENSTLGYLRTSPRSVVINIADVCDKTGTDIQIYAAKLNPQAGNPCDKIVADIQNLAATAQNIGANIYNFQNYLFSSIANSVNLASNFNQSPTTSLQNQAIQNPSQEQSTPTLALVPQLKPIIQSQPTQPPADNLPPPANQNANQPAPRTETDNGQLTTNNQQQKTIEVAKLNQNNFNAVPWPGFVFAPPFASLENNQTPEPDVTPPEKPTIATNDGQDFTTTESVIILEGGKSEDSIEILINDLSENVVYPSDTTWQKQFTLQEGENIFEIKAKDAAGNVSESASIKVIKNLMTPEIKFYLTDYDVREQNFALNWEDKNNVAENWELQYKLAPNSEWQDLVLDPRENKLDFIAQRDGLTYYFRLRAKDARGDYTDWIELQADIFSSPAVINEVAWMGTEVHSNDEWIELYNNTNNDIDLTNWILESSDGSPKIEFNESYKKKVKLNKDKTPIIKAKSFFLLERTDDDATAEDADWIFTGALNNKEGLVLKENETIIDRVGVWYAGNNGKKTSMERISSIRKGDEIDNWKDNDEMTANGNVKGTPKKKNSLIKIMDGTYARNVEFLEYPDVVYLIKSFQLESGFILTVNAGAVVKFNVWTEDDPVSGVMNIFGDLIAKGAADKKIYFTSARDDLIGGDTNGDGEATLPDKNDWDALHFYSPSKRSQFEYVDLKYAYSAVYSEDADLSFADSSVSFSEDGIVSYGGNLNVLRSVFSHMDYGYGVYAERGGLTLKDNNFNGNYQPLYIDFRTEFEHSGNSVSDNIYNGIILYGAAENGGRLIVDSDRILRKDIPYIILASVDINESASLTVEKGVIIKLLGQNTAINVSGALIAEGDTEEKIIFTSIFDDLSGGVTYDGEKDWNAPPRDKKWRGINFNQTAEKSVIKNVKIAFARDGIYFDSLASFGLEDIEISESEEGMSVYKSALNARNFRILNISGEALVIYNDSIVNIDSLIIENVDEGAIVVFNGTSLVLKNSTVKNVNDDALVAFNDSSVEIINSVFDGGTGSGIIMFNDSVLLMKNSSIKNFDNSGVLDLGDNDIIAVENSEIKNNDYGVYVHNASVEISNSDISGNASYGIYSEPENQNIVNAENNWWGDGSGPLNQDLNPEGAGDEVSGNVNFEPWLETNPS